MDAHETIRFRLTVHYDGSAFHGWQVQPDLRTVQGDLEAALSRLADRPVSVTGSGRTDTGVHATGQVATADMPASWSPATLRRSINALLSDDVWVASVALAPADFHPRYDALTRTYRYEVGIRPEAVSPFHRRWCWPLAPRDGSEVPSLDLRLLEASARSLVGEHSFEAFAKAGQPERGYRCRVTEVTWSETDLGIRLTITADRFLHHMVRYLTGTMVDIARGRRPAEDLTRLLACDPDVVTSPPAPAEGLFLHRVRYPGDAEADRERATSSDNLAHPPSRSPAPA